MEKDNEFVNLIKDLDRYIASGNARLQAILTALDWTKEDTLKESTCNTNDGDKESIDRNDPPLPESFGCDNSIVIENRLLQELINKRNALIPKKFSDIQLNFTRDQKSKIYDYVIDNTARTSEPELKVSFPIDDAHNSMTFAEIVAKAKKKDKKLQRKYRTSKPTHIEEVRNLVHLQMQALKDYFNPESDSQNQSHKKRDRFSEKSRCRDNYKTIENPYRKIGHHQSRRSERSPSIDRRNRLYERKSPKSSHKRKRSRDLRNEDRDKGSMEKIRNKSVSPRSKKKQKHHRKH